ncbi:MAG: response regulator transcription factor [Paludibacter sp.]|nr:response regulator transcription factor [Paludibacter sp.]
MKRVLIVEDDGNLGSTITRSLEMRKLDVHYSDGGGNVFEVFEWFRPNIVLLDVIIGGRKAGFEIAGQIRVNYHTPIIFMTALDAPEDLKSAFSFENTDYINKPFNLLELFLRIDKFLSHKSRYNLPDNYYQLGLFTFYPDENSLVKDNLGIHLNNCETAVLTVLCKSINCLVNRSVIISTVWGVDDYKIKEGSLNNTICSLRKRLSADSRIKIESVIKVGVKLTMEL